MLAFPTIIMKNKQRQNIQQELAKLRRQKTVLWGGVLFFVAVVVWTSFSILGSQKEVKLDPQLTELAKPLVPRLKYQVFEMIESKREIAERDLETFPIFVYAPIDDKKGSALELVNIIEVLKENELESEEASLSAELELPVEASSSVPLSNETSL